jgi:tetratricopeptide (TPR) repeat protein
MIAYLEADQGSRVDFAIYAFSVFKPFPGMVQADLLDSIGIHKYRKAVTDYCSEMPISDFTVFSDARFLRHCSAIQMAMYNKLLPESGRKAEIYLNMGALCRLNGAMENALSFYKKAIGRGNNRLSEIAYRERSKIFKELGRPELAKKEYEKAKQLYRK